MPFQSNVKRDDEFGKLSNGTLVFPQDMDKIFYPEAIKFGIYQRQGPSYSKFKENVKVVAGDAIEKSGITEENKPLLEKNAISNVIDGGVAAVKGVRALGGLVDATTQTLKEITKLANEKSVDHHIQSIYLNMPSSVVYNEAVGWQGTDMGVMGALKAGQNMGALELSLIHI